MSARVSVAAAAAIGAASLLVPSALGYDAWAWMVWARELAHGDLATTAGPSWKPLPALLIAPVALVADAAAPAVWLAVVRAAAVLALLLAFALGRRVAGTAAGLTAAALLATGADLYRTALLGSSEPLLVALVLAAVLLLLDFRPIGALAALAAAGLIRPEAWPFIALLGLVLVVRERGARRGLVVVLALAAPAIWLGLDWAGSGSPLHAGEVARVPTENSASGPLEVLTRVGGTLIAPAFAAIAAGIVLAWRRDPRVLAMAAAAAVWIALVALGTEAGFTGARRYLAAPAALLCVVGGAGVGWTLAAVRDGRARTALAAAMAAVVAAFAFVPARTDARLLSVAAAQADQLAELRRAVGLAGGRPAVVAAGRPAVNPWLQTALAWELSVPLGGVQPTWGARSWRAPALVFRAPRRLAGTRPALPEGVRARRLARAGRWQVLEAG